MFYNSFINFGANNMSNTAFSASVENLTFSLIYDYDCSSPREDNDGNVAHFFSNPHSRSGCVDNIDDSMAILNSLAKQLNIPDYYDLEQFDLIRAIEKADPNKEVIVVEPLYKFEHSGVIYNTSPFTCPWDSGQIGYIFSTINDFKSVGLEWNAEKAKEYIKGELDLYNNYISGECYGFRVEEKSTCNSCSADHEEELIGVWGYVGEQNEIIKMIASDYLDSYPNLKQKVLESV